MNREIKFFHRETLGARRHKKKLRSSQKTITYMDFWRMPRNVPQVLALLDHVSACVPSLYRDRLLGARGFKGFGLFLSISAVSGLSWSKGI